MPIMQKLGAGGGGGGGGNSSSQSYSASEGPKSTHPAGAADATGPKIDEVD